MGFGPSQARLARFVAGLRTEQAGFDGPKDRVRSPQIKSKTVSQPPSLEECLPQRRQIQLKPRQHVLARDAAAEVVEFVAAPVGAVDENGFEFGIDQPA